MTNIFCYILLSFSVVFLLAVIIGKAGKDEPLSKQAVLPDLDEHEIFWHKKYEDGAI